MPRNKKNKPEAPVVDITAVPSVDAANVVIPEPAAAPAEVVENEVVAGAAPVVLPEPLENPPAPVVVMEDKGTTFEMVVQQDIDGHDSTYAIKFTMPKDTASKVDFIIGTAIDSLFNKMEVAKATKTKLFDSRKPLLVSIKSSQHTIDLGKIDQVFLNKMKVNNGVRSKLAFIDRVIAITNDLCRTIVPTRATQLREDAKQAIQLRYGGTAPKGSISETSVVKIASTELVVTEEGQLVEA